LQTAISLSPNLAYPYNTLGIIYNDLKMYDQALATILKAIELDSNYAAAVNNSGVIYANKGDYEKSVEMFKFALTKEPNTPEFYNNLGNVYGIKLMDNLAIDCFQKSLSFCANYLTYYWIGALLIRNHKYAEACDYLEKAIAMQPEFAEAYFNLALAYGKLKDKDKEHKYFELAVKLNPELLNDI